MYPTCGVLEVLYRPRVPRATVPWKESRRNALQNHKVVALLLVVVVVLGDSDVVGVDI